MKTSSIHYEIDEKDLKSWGELVGNFYITGNAGEIAEVDTYIDSWLTCLAEGVEALRQQDRVEIEIPEEREPLRFERIGDGLVIHYGSAFVEISSLEEFERGLVVAASHLVSRATALNLDRNGAFVASVERLAAKAI